MKPEPVITGREAILRIAEAADVAARRLLSYEKVDAACLTEVSRRFWEQTAALPEDGEDAWWIASLDQLARAYQHGCGTAGYRWADLAARYTVGLRERMNG